VNNVWCVRADFGKYAEQFVAGGYAAIGWLDDTDLGGVKSREELYPLYQSAYPKDTSKIVIGQQVGQIARFLLEIQAGDYVLTPSANSELVHYGEVGADPSYFVGTVDDGCPYLQRRRVEWIKEPILRTGFSVPFQNTMRSSLTVFSVSQREEFLAAIGRQDLAPPPPAAEYDAYGAVLRQVLTLDAQEFEFLVGHLLTALGFEGSEVTGKPGDGGVDATGELNVANLAKVRVFVQAKRYKLGVRISANLVKQLRASIPVNGQGAFITTADFQDKAAEVALQPGFPRIGLVNGRQLVDLLVEHWDDIPQVFQDKLGLRRGLVLA